MTTQKKETKPNTEPTSGRVRRLVRWWFNFRHDVMGWHNCKGGGGEFDGCSQHARCSCGKEVMQDSQGNWF